MYVFLCRGMKKKTKYTLAVKPVSGVSRETGAREATQRVGTVGEHVARPVLALVLVYWQTTTSILLYTYYTTPVIRPSVERRRPVWDALRCFGAAHSPGTWHEHPPYPSLQWHNESRQAPFWQGVPSLASQSSAKKMNEISSNNSYVSTIGKQRTTVTRGKHGARNIPTRHRVTIIFWDMTE